NARVGSQSPSHVVSGRFSARQNANNSGHQRVLGMGSTALANGTVLYVGEVGGYDGSWSNPDDMRKLNGIIRYSQGTWDNGFSMSGMAYSNPWNSTDQVPLRAITSREIGLYDATFRWGQREPLLLFRTLGANG